LFRIRRAIPADVASIATLIDQSVRGLQQQDYSQAQIDGALGTVFGVDSQLIADGTYFVVEAVLDDGSATLVGCGGWSKRKTLFGSDLRSGREDELLDPLRDAAKIRAFFVQPDWARRSIGTKILTACEHAASEAGFRTFELGATLTGEKLYAARGYEVMERIEVALVNGVSLPIIRMWKRGAG
jgi:N-acetylglutamate synthase-like GNAT family acetyltransferase